MPYFFMDKYYLILVVPALILAFWAQYKVKSTFRKYSGVKIAKQLTGADAAKAILNANQITTVTVERVSGELTDHFDSRSNLIRLSDSVYSSNSVAAVGVAAHECGHAIQYARKYFPIKLRSAVIPISNFGSSLGIPLAMLGIVMGFDILITVGIVLFLAVVALQLLTLPVEFNASRRAVKTLRENGILDEDELRGVKKVLTAAALTYVASFVISLANLIRLLLLKDRKR